MSEKETSISAKETKKSVLDLTWQDADKLKYYTTETGKILPRKITKLSAKEQRHITTTIKRARNLLLLK